MVGRLPKYSDDEQRRIAKRERNRVRKRLGRRYKSKNERHYVWGSPDASVEMLAERDRVFEQEWSLSQIYFGDPLPGRSALDQRAALDQREKESGRCTDVGLADTGTGGGGEDVVALPGGDQGEGGRELDCVG